MTMTALEQTKGADQHGSHGGKEKEKVKPPSRQGVTWKETVTTTGVAPRVASPTVDWTG